MSNDIRRYFDITITVRYDGLKATQYFSKFTELSVKILRADLTEMGLPHPKRINFTFISHGCVECYFPSVLKGSVLYRNIIARGANPNSEMDLLKAELSISNLSVVEKFLTPPSPYKNPLKRSNPYDNGDTYANYKPDKSDLGGVKTLNGLFSTSEAQDPILLPPYKMAKFVHASCSASRAASDTFNSNASSLLDKKNSELELDSLHPEEIVALWHASKLPKTGWRPELSHALRKVDPHLPKQPRVTPRPATDQRQPLASQAEIPKANNEPQQTKLEINAHEFLNAFRLDSTKPHLIIPNSMPQAGSIVRMPSTQEKSSSASNPLSALGASDTEIAAKKPSQNLASRFGPKLMYTTKDLVLNGPLPEQKSMTNDLPSSPRSPPDISAKVPQVLAVKLATPSASSAVPSLTAAKEDLQQKTKGSPALIPPVIAAESSSSKLQLSISPSVSREGLKYASPVTDFRRKSIFSDNSQSMNTSNGDLKHAIQRKLREANDVQREIMANSVRHKTIISELKALRSSTIPEPVIIGVNPSEETNSRLEKLEREITTERRLRREAESALEDVRRECRAPFVVPSLLDAFVELSKLTTRGIQTAAARDSVNSLPWKMEGT